MGTHAGILDRPKKPIFIRILASIFLALYFIVFGILVIFPAKILQKFFSTTSPSATAQSCCSVRAILYSLGIDRHDFESCFLDWSNYLSVKCLLRPLWAVHNCKPSDARPGAMNVIGMVLARRLEAGRLLQQIADDYKNDPEDSNHKNFKNVVYLGAGLDALFHEYQEVLPRSVKLFEVDTGPMQKYKLERINGSRSKSKTQLPWSNNIRYCPVDFEKEDFVEKLKTATQFDPSQRTLYLWIGVCPYLDR